MRGTALACTLAILGVAGFILCNEARAANWFEVQTIPPPDFGKADLLGFLQPTYSDLRNAAAANGQIPTADRIAPNDEVSNDWAIQRARLFVRGTPMPDITYYVGTEFGQNNYAYSFGRYAPRLIDANVVFSHFVPGVRFELGVIRAPGPEDAMQGFMDFSFLDVFPTAIGQLMQPSFFTKHSMYKAAVHNGFLVPGAELSGDNGFRYPGVQLMDWFRIKPRLELAYGVMVGDYGRQLESATANGSIVASRVQLSHLFDDGGGRFFRNDLTGFLWYQRARPQLNNVSTSMVRYGFGVTYRRDYMKAFGQNLKAEYLRGTGNIAVPATFDAGPGLQPAQYDSVFYPGANNRAAGYAVTAGLFLTHHIELNARYDYYDRLPNIASQERVFKNTALGATYHVTPLTRVAVDYIFRKVEVPNPGAIGAAGSPTLNLADSIVDGIGNEFHIFAVIAF